MAVFCIAKVIWAGLRWWVSMLLHYAEDVASDPFGQLSTIVWPLHPTAHLTIPRT
nr:hypothetical protein Iba_scaffold1442161CG0010 [Ipomoea batatas]